MQQLKNVLSLLILIFLLAFASKQAVAGSNNFGMRPAAIDQRAGMYYQSDPLTGTAHPGFKFENDNVYWEEHPDGAELVFQFDLNTSLPVFQGGFFCREADGTPIGGSRRSGVSSSLWQGNNEFFAAEDLAGALVPGKNYAWNAFLIHEGEVIESPLFYFVHTPNPQVEDWYVEVHVDLEQYALEVFNLTNAERVKNGLQPLGALKQLARAAEVRAVELISLLSHARPDGRDCFSVYREHGIEYNSAGENIAMGQKTPKDVVEGWMNSPAHRANILQPGFDYLGVGVAVDEGGKLYWTQNFIGIKP